ncbi:response regulator [Candidatus Desantisbacteria bacterium]|nr:response regulator [Candidatus Desantisbacteria bacterium]
MGQIIKNIEFIKKNEKRRHNLKYRSKNKNLYSSLNLWFSENNENHEKSRNNIHTDGDKKEQSPCLSKFPISEQKHKILIVDDNEELCENLSDIIKFKGYEVYTVYDGYKAIDAVKNNKYNMVIIDVKMPGINGVDTLKILKDIDPDLNFVMITAFANDIAIKDGLKKLEYKVMHKPIDIDKLLNMIRDVCGH